MPIKHLFKHLWSFVIILLTAFVYFLPIIFDPTLLLNRNNDLKEQFWPVFYYLREQVLLNHAFPLWNNLFLSGTPLLPDQQFSLFYPLNLLFVVFPTDNAFVIYFLLHSILAGISMFLLSKYGFSFSKLTSLILSLMYIFTPKLSGYIIAGHPGLFATQTWLPLLILSIILMIKRPSLTWSILLSFSLAGIFYTHTVIFVLSSIFSLILFLLLFLHVKGNKRSVVFFLIGVLLTFGLIAVTFLPQIEWIPHTNRFLLLQDRDVHPKWLSLMEFTKSIFTPWLLDIKNIESEKLLSIGIAPSLLAFVGLIKLRKKIKFLFISLLCIVVIVSLNNISPFINQLLSQDWFILMRVSTRIWFVLIFICLYLAGLGLESLLNNKKFKKISLIFIFAVLVELLLFSWTKLSTPIVDNSNQAPIAILEFIKKDRQQFRVFCINRCISQKDAAINNLELIEGYNTLIQKNYYQQSWQLTNSYWSYYSLSLPPFGIIQFTKIRPDAKSLGEYNTKYIVSPYQLNDNYLKLIQQSGNYYLYKNDLFKERAYYLENQIPTNAAKIVEYTPNFIRIDTSNHKEKNLVLSEVYSKGWNAYLNGKEPVNVQEKSNALRLVDIKEDTQFVDFRYEPTTFKIGLVITLFTSFLIIIILIRKLFIRTI